jgi:hypothetical protein
MLKIKVILLFHIFHFSPALGTWSSQESRPRPKALSRFHLIGKIKAERLKKKKLRSSLAHQSKLRPSLIQPTLWSRRATALPEAVAVRVLPSVITHQIRRAAQAEVVC